MLTLIGLAMVSGVWDKVLLALRPLTRGFVPPV